MPDAKKGMESLMGQGRTFPPPADIQSNAHIDSTEQYQEMWDKRKEDRGVSWDESGGGITIG